MAQQVDVDLIVEAISKGFDKVHKDLGKVEKAEKDLVKTQSRSQRVLQGVQKNWAAIGLGIGAATGALVTAKKAFEFSKEGAQIAKVRDTFDSLTASIGSTSMAMLRDLNAATEGMVSNTDLMMSANRFLSMGLANSAAEASELSRIAVSLGGAMGKEATPAMEEFALLLANQSIPRLDTFGISAGTVRKKINDLRKEFPEMTRETAFMTAVMDEAAVSMEKLGDAVPTDPFAQFEKNTKDITDELKILAAELLGPAFEFINLQFQSGKLNEELLRLTGSTAKVAYWNRIAYETFTDEAERVEYLRGIVEGYSEAEQEAAQKKLATQEALQHVQDIYTGALEDTADAVEEEAEATDMARLSKVNWTSRTREQIQIGQDYVEQLEEQEKALAELAREEERQGRLFADIAKGGLKFFNEELDELGPKLVVIGGQTAEQNRIFEEAERNYEQNADAIADYQVGLRGFGKSADEVNEIISDLSDEQAHWSSIMNEFSGEQGEANLVTQEATVNYEELNQAVFDSVLAFKDEEDQLGLTAAQMGAAGLALGTLNEQQVDAIVQAAILTDAIRDITQAYYDGTISAGEMDEALRAVADGTYETIEAFIQGRDRAAEMNAEVDKLDRSVNTEVEIEVHGLGSLREAVNLLQQVGSVGTSSQQEAAIIEESFGPDANPYDQSAPGVTPNPGGPQLPDDTFAHGGSFTVPSGYPNDSYLIGVQSGEHVQVTPRGQAGGGGVTININGGDTAEVRRVVDDAITRAGVRANATRRTI